MFRPIPRCSPFPLWSTFFILYANAASPASTLSTNTVTLSDSFPAPPAPEPIEIHELPLPPATQSTAPGSCSRAINPHLTGCIGTTTGLQGGTFTPDGDHVLATVRYAGASGDPDDPTSIYTGQQVVVIKADGGVFVNGDAWKCLTCGVTLPNNGSAATVGYSYPQAFRDGKRVLAGTMIISCGEKDLVSEDCKMEDVSIYPIRLDDQADGSGPGASLRELRLHPDNVHIGLNSYALTASGSVSEYAYYGRLQFDAAPTTGTPLAPRYDVVNASVLLDNSGSAPVYTVGDELFLNNSAITVGELRGFSGTGNEITYIGSSVESCNIDVFAVNIFTGAVRRLTTNPGYCDPVEMSPDDNWIVIQDTRFSGRTDFMDGLRWLPPIADLVTELACASVRNNGNRRFFQPWLLDRYGDRGDYYGQNINDAVHGAYGSGAVDDPQWNGQADPWFSPDGTSIVYWQAQAVAPACGGSNPLPCYNSTEPGGRDGRIMLAKLTSRTPLPKRDAVEPFPDAIPWAVPYVPGGNINDARGAPSGGVYTLHGALSGHANVTITENAAGTAIEAVYAEYFNYSDHETAVISGYQNVSGRVEDVVITYVDWSSDLTSVGSGIDEPAKQVTSSDGFHMSISVLTNIFEANGTLVTEVDGMKFGQPVNGG